MVGQGGGGGRGRGLEGWAARPAPRRRPPPSPGHLDAAQALLDAGAEPSIGVEGSPALHLAVCAGLLPGRGDAAAAAGARSLLAAGASAYARDDAGRTALHWAAYYGFEGAIGVLLEAAAVEAASLAAAAVAATAAAAAAAAAAVAAGEEPPLPLPPHPAPPPLVDAGDRQGATPLHLAAKAGRARAAAALLAAAGARSAAVAGARSKAGQAPLHVAAAAGAGPTAAVLLSAAPTVATESCRRQRTPAQWAAARGHMGLAAALAAGDAAAAAVCAPPPPPPTLILAPDECLEHHTAPVPVTRAGPEPPPEHAGRLVAVSDARLGILRGAGFESLAWSTAPRRATAADVLRVHDWAYVRALQAACGRVPDDPAAVGHLDGDTAVSHRSFDAALIAAGAVCDAVDAVLDGSATHAFCAIRPPGHHAGPSGVVACANDPAGSHGFCLLNNVAIGAAYALGCRRGAGVERVAILDFDVHHGNGTQACVAGVAPALQRHPVSTPFSEGEQVFPVFKPWLDWDDAARVFFASVQGYGPKDGGHPAAGWVYPGSGGTCDTAPRAASVGFEGDAAAAAAADGPDADDPNLEFAPAPGVEAPPPSGPRVINVGLGQGPDAAKWRRAWRDKIFPALAAFRPDLIIVSAGFDAHKKDDINFR